MQNMDISTDSPPIKLLDLSLVNENCLGRLREVDRELILLIDSESSFKQCIASWLQENPSEAGLLPAQVKSLPPILGVFLSQFEAASLNKVAFKQANTSRLLGHVYATINV